MGNKATEEVISTVRSVVGPEVSDMDIIRALHMAKNDPTAAINIIFDTPRSFKKPELPKIPEPSNCNLMTEPPVTGLSLNQDRFRVQNHDNGLEPNVSSEGGGGRDECEDNGDSNGGPEKLMGSEWWFVGSAEMAGLSTCKGRTLKPGDEISFVLPVEKKLPTPSPGKVGGGRGRQVASCSEIVRFSTKSGEVLWINLL